MCRRPSYRTQSPAGGGVQHVAKLRGLLPGKEGSPSSKGPPGSWALSFQELWVLLPSFLSGLSAGRRETRRKGSTVFPGRFVLAKRSRSRVLPAAYLRVANTRKEQGLLCGASSLLLVNSKVFCKDLRQAARAGRKRPLERGPGRGLYVDLDPRRGSTPQHHRKPSRTAGGWRAWGLEDPPQSF